MFAFLRSLVLMVVIVMGTVKAYYDVPLVNENPYAFAGVGLLILLVLGWLFPRFSLFLVKLAVFSVIVYFICHSKGWDLSFLRAKPAASKPEKITETVNENIDNTLDKIKDALQLEKEEVKKFTAKNPPVISGSNLRIGGETVQLYGIDAPDMEQVCWTRFGNIYSCGKLAKEEMQKLVGGKSVSCENKGKRSGKIVATCYVDGEDLAGVMVHYGWAVADRAVTNTYVEEEKSAHDKKLGLWSGRFQAPWVWRAKYPTNEPEDLPEEESYSPFQKIMEIFQK